MVRSDYFGRLAEAATAPYDLSAPGALLAGNRLEKYVCRTKFLNLHYASQRLDNNVLALLQGLADELDLVEQFKAMRRGAVMNRIEGHDCENRQVLHTACRDLFSAKPAATVATESARGQLEKLQLFLADVDSGRVCNHKGDSFTSLIHVGIGGSDLGPRAVFEGLRAWGQEGKDVHFVANVDPDDAARVLSEVDLASCLLVIVSKSGTTLETLTNEKIFRGALEEAGLDPAKHCVAVTGEQSPMDDSSRYLQSFYMYDSIGGRFSSTSMVGAVTLGFYLGLEQFKKFLAGAAAMDLIAEENELTANLPLLLALLGIWNHNFLGYPTLAVLPYSQALHRFPAHLQQCDMESNGKSIHRDGGLVQCKTGPVIWGEPGTNGQHAFYQLLHQGTELVPVEFIGFKSCQYGMDREVAGSSSQDKLLANLLAQMVAMATGKDSANLNRKFPGNRPSCLLMADRLTPEVMGALLACYEAKIVFQGFCWNINSFDQEGVQLGKILAQRFLSAMDTKADLEEYTLERIILAQL